MKVRVDWTEADACELGRALLLLMPYIRRVLWADSEGALLDMIPAKPVTLEEWIDYVRKKVKGVKLEVSEE